MLRPRLSIVFLTICLALTCVGITATRISAEPSKRPVVAASTSIVQKYFRIFNAGMKNGNFAPLKSVYATNGILRQSNPLGETKVSRGLAQITAFYQAAYTKFKGAHWTQDSTRLLSKNVVLNYEFAGDATFKVPGRCAHLFVIKNGKIKSLDWITFYSGQK